MLAPLSRRERQIMDALYRLGRATAVEVREGLSDAPSDSAVRTHLRILEEKGHVGHTQEGQRYVYAPTEAPEKASRSALRHLVRTFFDGSPERAVAALLDASDLSDADLDRMAVLIEQARREGR
jgi:predicted transcriptional regulator